MSQTMLDLSRIPPGFSSPVYASQAVFRQCLGALASPGTVFDVTHDAKVPAPLMPAAGALALALLDRDTTVWLSASLRGADVDGFLRFHTGCRLVSEPGDADFAFVASFEELPAFDAFASGSDEFPEDTVTLVLQTSLLSSDFGWSLTGPGINLRAQLHAAGYGTAFADAWRANHQLFPRGADAFFASGNQLCGLPRTTMIAI